MKTCQKCLRWLDEDTEFYCSKQTDKYPDGKLDICKSCIRESVKNDNFGSFGWVLEEVDCPFIYDEWIRLIQRYGIDSYILGRYLAKMKLKGYKAFTFQDTMSLTEWSNTQHRNHFGQ